jgi:hypothetical protein
MFNNKAPRKNRIPVPKGMGDHWVPFPPGCLPKDGGFACKHPGAYNYHKGRYPHQEKKVVRMDFHEK